MGSKGVLGASVSVVLLMVMGSLFMGSSGEETNDDGEISTDKIIDRTVTPNILDMMIPLEGKINSYEFTEDGNLIFTSRNDGFYSLDHDGNVNWYHQSFSSDLKILGLIEEKDPLMENGRYLEKYDGTTGDLLWSYDILGEWKIEFNENYTFIIYDHEYIDKISNDGELLWKWPEAMTPYVNSHRTNAEYKEKPTDGRLDPWSFEQTADGGFTIVQEIYGYMEGEESRHTFSLVSCDGETAFNFTNNRSFSHLIWGEDHLMKYWINKVPHMVLLDPIGKEKWRKTLPVENIDSLTVISDTEIQFWEEAYDEDEDVEKYSLSQYSLHKDGDIEKLIGPIKSGFDISRMGDTFIFIAITINGHDINDYQYDYMTKWNLTFFDINGETLWDETYDYFNDTLEIEYDTEGGLLLVRDENYTWIHRDGTVTQGKTEDLDPAIIDQGSEPEEEIKNENENYVLTGNVSKFDENGILLWSFIPSGGTGQTPLVDEDGNFYVATQNNRMIKVNFSGEIEWEIELNISLRGDPLLVKNNDTGLLLLQSVTGHVTGIALNGSIVWEMNLEEYTSGSPVVINENKTLLSTSFHLTMIANNGEGLWSTELESSGPKTPFIDPEGNIYVSTYDHLSALDEMGNILWSVEDHEKYDSWSNPVMFDNGNLLLSDNGMFCFDTDGDQLWNITREDRDLYIDVGYSYSYWDFDELITNDRGEIYGLNQNEIVRLDQEGQALWEFRIHWDGGKPVFDDDGNIFIVNQGLMALSPEGDVLWHYKTNLLRNQNGNIDYKAVLTDDGIAFYEGSLYHLRWSDGPGNMDLRTPEDFYIGSMGSLNVDHDVSKEGAMVSAYRVYRGDSPDNLTFWKDIEPYAGREEIFEDDEWEIIEYFQVEAINDQKISPRSDVFSNSMIWEDTTPSPPLVTDGTMEDGGMTISWVASAYNGGHNITGYIILRGLDSDDYEVIDRVGPDTFEYHDNDVPDGHIVKWKVAAENEKGYTGSDNGWKIQTAKETPGPSTLIAAGASTVLLVCLAIAAAYIVKARAERKYEEQEREPSY